MNICLSIRNLIGINIFCLRMFSFGGVTLDHVAYERTENQKQNSFLNSDS